MRALLADATGIYALSMMAQDRRNGTGQRSISFLLSCRKKCEHLTQFFVQYKGKNRKKIKNRWLLFSPGNADIHNLSPYWIDDAVGIKHHIIQCALSANDLFVDACAFRFDFVEFI